MPDEPKSPEELLAAYAEQRRREQGDPASLAAFRRKQLQDEVARTYGTGATAAKAGWWTWPRLAWLGVACAVTVVGVLNFNPAQEQRLALQRSASAPANTELQDNLAADSLALKEAAPPALSEPVDALSITPRPLDRTDKAKADSFGRTEIAATPADNAIAPPPPASASSRSLETLSRDQSRSPAGDAVKLSERPLSPQLGLSFETRQQAALEDETKRLAKAELGREITETKSLADVSDVMLKQAELKDTTNARLFYAEGDIAAANQAAPSQRYVQVDNRAQYRRNFNSPPPLPVMNQFSVQQNGPQVIIVDADGSQYTGLITNAPALAQTLAGQTVAPSTEMVQRFGIASAQALPAVQTAAAGGVSGAEPNSVWFFRVSGTNRSLNQTVVFEGNLLNSVPAELEAIKAQNTQAGVGEPTTPLATATAAPAQSANSSAYNFQSSPGLSNTYQNFYQNAYQNSQIRGRVTVGGSNQVEINALSAQP